MLTVPESILQDLLCVNCKSWLSSGPINVLPNGTSMCGRCQTNQRIDQYIVRHIAYESLANYFTFPCKYWSRHCPEIMKYNDVENHEQNCVYSSSCKTFFSDPGAAFKSRRSLDLRSVISITKIPEHILELLKCNTCEGYLNCGPIMVWEDGTSLCHRCLAKHGARQGEYTRHKAFESLVDMLIFPCVYRHRGCTQHFKFGEQIWGHELDCSYGKMYKKEKMPRKPGEKTRGVIETHTGHIYATITSATQPFAPPVQTLNRQEQGQFVKDFQKHRESLTYMWDNKTPSSEPPKSARASLNMFQFPVPNSYHVQAATTYKQMLHQPDLNNGPIIYENPSVGGSLMEELKHKQKFEEERRENTDHSIGDSKNSSINPGLGDGTSYNSNPRYSHGWNHYQNRENGPQYRRQSSAPKTMEYSVY